MQPVGWVPREISTPKLRARAQNQAWGWPSSPPSPPQGYTGLVVLVRLCLCSDATCCNTVGEKLSDEEVDALLVGVEDSQGQVNYEGMHISRQW